MPEGRKKDEKENKRLNQEPNNVTTVSHSCSIIFHFKKGKLFNSLFLNCFEV